MSAGANRLRAPAFWQRMGVAAALVAAGDFLLFRQPLGVSVFLFAAAVAVAVAGLHLMAFARGRAATTAIPLLALAPLLDNVSPLSCAVALAGLALFALVLSGRLQRGLARAGRQAALFLMAMPFRLPGDVLRWRKAARDAGRKIRGAGLVAWIVPLALGAVFIGLFAAANPIIDHWLSLIDLELLLDLVDPARVIFWLFLLAAVWAFLRPRLLRLPRVRQLLAAFKRMPKASNPKAAAFEGALFGKAAILRSLLLFNLLFAVQTVLDAAYLWGGVRLPEGMNYAAYAHRGAYPLIVTALLAAAFVLVALRSGSEAPRDRTIRWLVYLWIAQNVLLVVSSILRLDLYIDVYSLTYWRVAAFIWMGLVAAGLVFIVIRIALSKSGEWLISANLLTLSATLYVCCFVNFAGLIAGYNVDHSSQISGKGVSLDQFYLQSLGPAALPVADRFLAHPVAGLTMAGQDLAAWRRHAEAEFRTRHQEWRAWSFRNWQLARYLDGVPATADAQTPGN